jgi:6-phosphogluconolactonase
MWSQRAGEATVTVANDVPATEQAAAGRFAALVERACEERGSAIVCLTGGSTPRGMYRRLGDPAGRRASRVRWPDVHFFWGDERHVPPDHPESNFGMARRELVDLVPVPPAQVHRMRGELPDPEAAALEYETELRQGFAAAGRGDLTFDIMLLGIGADAHIASVFPGSPLLLDGGSAGSRGAKADEVTPARRVAAVVEPYANRARITLTPVALLDARAILVLAAGRAKAAAVAAALRGDEDIARWPAQLLRRAGDRVEWILDREAAAPGADC